MKARPNDSLEIEEIPNFLIREKKKVKTRKRKNGVDKRNFGLFCFGNHNRKKGKKIDSLSLALCAYKYYHFLSLSSFASLEQIFKTQTQLMFPLGLWIIIVILIWSEWSCMSVYESEWKNKIQNKKRKKKKNNI